MAKIQYNVPVENMTGALDSGHKFVQRRKHLRDTNGIVIHTCATEAYLVSNPRDYKRTPPQGNELAHLQLFGQAARQTAALLSALKPDADPTEQQLEEIEAYRQRFQSQLRKKPDPMAPLGPDGKPKRYHRFDNFIRAMKYQELKQ